MIEISRRAVLSGGLAVLGAGLAFTVLDATPASAAERDTPSIPALKALRSLDVSTPTHGFGSMQIMSIPVLINFSWPATWSRHAAVDIGYDSNRFRLTNHFKATVDRRAVSAEQSGAHFALSLPNSNEEVFIEFALPLAPIDNYPAEDIAPLAPVLVRLSDAQDGSRSATIASSSTSSSLARAWGIELYGVWESVATSRSGREYRRPAGVRVVSVGPSPSPADAAIQVTADSRMVRSFAVHSAARNNRPAAAPAGASTHVAGASALMIPIGTALAAGETVDLAFAASDLHGTLSGVRAGAVSLVAINQAAWFQRTTSRETAVSSTGSGGAATVRQFMGSI